jgi:hypothetical protein
LNTRQLDGLSVDVYHVDKVTLHFDSIMRRGLG